MNGRVRAYIHHLRSWSDESLKLARMEAEDGDMARMGAHGEKKHSDLHRGKSAGQLPLCLLSILSVKNKTPPPYIHTHTHTHVKRPSSSNQNEQTYMFQPGDQHQHRTRNSARRENYRASYTCPRTFPLSSARLGIRPLAHWQLEGSYHQP